MQGVATFPGSKRVQKRRTELLVTLPDGEFPVQLPASEIIAHLGFQGKHEPARKDYALFGSLIGLVIGTIGVGVIMFQTSPIPTAVLSSVSGGIIGIISGVGFGAFLSSRQRPLYAARFRIPEGADTAVLVGPNCWEPLDNMAMTEEQYNDLKNVLQIPEPHGKTDDDPPKLLVRPPVTDGMLYELNQVRDEREDMKGGLSGWKKFEYAMLGLIAIVFLGLLLFGAIVINGLMKQNASQVEPPPASTQDVPKTRLH